LCRMMTSSEMSYKLSCTPRLLNVVFEEFLPMSFTPVAGSHHITVNMCAE